MKRFVVSDTHTIWTEHAEAWVQPPPKHLRVPTNDQSAKQSSTQASASSVVNPTAHFTEQGSSSSQGGREAAASKMEVKNSSSHTSDDTAYNKSSASASSQGASKVEVSNSAGHVYGYASNIQTTEHSNTSALSSNQGTRQITASKPDRDNSEREPASSGVKRKKAETPDDSLSSEAVNSNTSKRRKTDSSVSSNSIKSGGNEPLVSENNGQIGSKSSFQIGPVLDNDNPEPSFSIVKKSAIGERPSDTHETVKESTDDGEEKSEKDSASNDDQKANNLSAELGDQMTQFLSRFNQGDDLATMDKCSSCQMKEMQIRIPKKGFKTKNSKQGGEDCQCGEVKYASANEGSTAVLNGNENSEPGS